MNNLTDCKCCLNLKAKSACNHRVLYSVAKSQNKFKIILPYNICPYHLKHMCSLFTETIML